MSNDEGRIKQLCTELAESLGFDQLLWIPLETPQRLPFYDEWLSRGWAGDMEYLHRHRPTKASPDRLLPEARSVLVATKSYVPAPRPHGKLEGLRMAAYAKSEDYHDWFKAGLSEAAHRLTLEFPGHHFRPSTDSDPLLERDHAVQAGAGWWAKNTCVIHPKKGSFFFLGEILSTVTVGLAPAPLPDFCGRCTACIDICPTGAIEKPRELNATKCISYWTIESKSLPPLDLREKFGDWFFGCDLCQSVCPWNQKPFRGETVLDASVVREMSGEGRESTVRDLRFILTATDRELRDFLRDSALSRAKPRGLRRNALIVIANTQLSELRREVERHLNDDFLKELAEEALRKIDAADLNPLPTS